MAYQKTQWKDHIEGVQVGTPVNAVNMNKIEEGIAAAAAAESGTCSMWTLRRDNDYGTQPRDVTWYKIGKFCLIPAVFTATQTASRVRTIAGLPYPAKDYTCVPMSYAPVSGTASLMGTIDGGKTEVNIQWLADNVSGNDGKYYDIRVNIIYRVED